MKLGNPPDDYKFLIPRNNLVRQVEDVGVVLPSRDTVLLNPARGDSKMLVG